MVGIVPGENGVIDVEILRSFRKLASQGRVLPGSRAGHADGWGIVIWEDSMPEYLAREPADASLDPKYDSALDSLTEQGTRNGKNKTQVLLAHLRKASSGATHVRENTHPFVFKEWAFAHNGTIRRMNLRDRTDSEWFFQSVMRRLERGSGESIEDAIASQVRSVQEVYDYSSLTFLLSDGKSLYGYRDCTAHDDYYTLYFRRPGKDEGGGVVVSQEKVVLPQGARWEEVPNGRLLRVNAKNLECELIPLT